MHPAMRNLFVLLLSGAVGLATLLSLGQAQEKTKEPEDPQKVLAGLLNGAKERDDEIGRAHV